MHDSIQYLQRGAGEGAGLWDQMETASCFYVEILSTDRPELQFRLCHGNNLASDLHVHQQYIGANELR